MWRSFIAVSVGGVIGWGLALAYTSAINQAFDARVDRLNVGKNPVGHVFAESLFGFDQLFEVQLQFLIVTAGRLNEDRATR